jgi:hypothetical protein
MTCRVAALACLGQDRGNGTEKVEWGMASRAEREISTPRERGKGRDARDSVGVTNAHMP